jgi:hypothetical protein
MLQNGLCYIRKVQTTIFVHYQFFLLNTINSAFNIIQYFAIIIQFRNINSSQKLKNELNYF